MLRGNSAKNALAAFCAATMRVGCTSVARMLPDTSIANMMVSCCMGKVTTAKGRDAANSITVIASKNKIGGMWRRKLGPASIASRTIDKLAKRTEAFFLRRSNHTYTAISSGNANSSHNNIGHMNVTGKLEGKDLGHQLLDISVNFMMSFMDTTPVWCHQATSFR